MGESPKGYSIERIDNNKGYSPDNCIWASRKVQNSNRRNTVFLVVDKVKIPLSDYAEKNKINYNTLLARYKKQGDNCIEYGKIILNSENGIYYNKVTDAAKSIGKTRDQIKYHLNKVGSYECLKLV